MVRPTRSRERFTNIFKRFERQMRLSMTFDQGSEMSKHKTLSKNTGVTVYFAHPHAPWERGICENINGLTPPIPPQVDRSLSVFPETARSVSAWKLNTRSQKNTRLESSCRTVPPRRRFRFCQVLVKHRQGPRPTFVHLSGPLKSGKQTALPTFQQPLLLECYKSIQTSFCCTWSLYPPTRLW